MMTITTTTTTTTQSKTSTMTSTMTMTIITRCKNAVTPDRVDHSVSLRNPFDWSVMPPPETLGIMWDRLYFAQETYSEIDVLLYGYREDPDNPGKLLLSFIN